MRVAQKPAQRPTQQPNARRRQTGGALHDESADQRWRELDQLLNPDPGKVALEAPQVAPVALERGRAKTTLRQQVLEEPRELVDERHLEQPAAASHEPGNNKAQHLLDRATDVLDALARGLRTELSSATRGDPLGYERVDMSW
jgi:hypothetical protein